MRGGGGGAVQWSPEYRTQDTPPSQYLHIVNRRIVRCLPHMHTYDKNESHVVTGSYQLGNGADCEYICTVYCIVYTHRIRKNHML